MANRISRRVLAWLSAALVSACVGGQTGQPDSDDCRKSLSAHQSWRGQSVRGLAEALAGTHTGHLQWEGVADAVPPDNISIRVAYAGEGAITDCGELLEVPVALEISTEQSGVAEQGKGTLVFRSTEAPLVASLSYSGSDVEGLSAALTEARLGVAPEGNMHVRGADYPASTATFGGGQ